MGGEVGEIEICGYIRMDGDRFDIGSEDKLIGGGVVVERPYARKIPRTKQPPRPSIPNRKSEIPQQMRRAVHTPFQVSVQDQLAVGKRLRQPQQAAQLVPVIDARIRRDGDIRRGEVDGERFRLGFGGDPGHLVAEGDAGSVPGMVGVTAVPLQIDHHPVQAATGPFLFLRWLENTTDRAQGRLLSGLGRWAREAVLPIHKYKEKFAFSQSNHIKNH
jgi:hypothetical protein